MLGGVKFHLLTGEFAFDMVGPCERICCHTSVQNAVIRRKGMEQLHSVTLYPGQPGQEAQYGRGQTFKCRYAPVISCRQCGGERFDSQNVALICRPFLMSWVTTSHEIEREVGMCKNGESVYKCCCLHRCLRA